MKFILACAGTAGHINPALSIAEAIKELWPDAELLFIGAGRPMENRLIPEAGYKIENIRIEGFSRSMSLDGIKKNLRNVKNLILSPREAGKIIDSFRPDCCIGTGGYVCYPVMKAAHKRGIPTALHESNAVPGLANKLLDGTVDRIMVAFKGTEGKYKHPERIVFTGTPIRGEFETVTREEARAALGIPVGAKVVTSFWGSLGAAGMNAKMVDFIKKNAGERAFYHIHATGGGKEGFEGFKEKLYNAGLFNYSDFLDLRPYIDDMGRVFAASDLVICRAGASTLAELTAVGRASILVPSEIANIRQDENALMVERAGGAKMLREKETDGAKLYAEAVALLSDGERIAQMEKGAASIGAPDSKKLIQKVILDILK